jgi:hypothetical protein
LSAFIQNLGFAETGAGGTAETGRVEMLAEIEHFRNVCDVSVISEETNILGGCTVAHDGTYDPRDRAMKL